MSPPVANRKPPPPEIPGYADLRLIGVGGMATVYLAVQESLGRPVALKLIRREDDGVRYQRFLKESRIIASLNHRNVITIHDVGLVENRPYISMEYLEGGDLERRMHQGALGIVESLTLIEEMASCLAFVHERGIVHRDIKPANILFHGDGTPILTDFGLAKQQEVDSRLTIDGTTVGTPYYISPEQAECKAVDGRADIYGLGVILYELLVGSKPFEGESAMQTIVAHLTDPIPTMPVELARYQNLIDRMLAKDPNDRFATAHELAAHLREIARDAVEAPRGEPPRRPFDVKAALDSARSRVLAVADDLTAPDGGIAAAVIAARRLVGRIRWRHPLFAAATVLIAVGAAVWYLLPSDPPAVRDYLRQAEVAMDEDRLSYPKAGSALYFYERVLELEPSHAAATRGLEDIADRYADLAEEEIATGDFQTAKFYIARGLEAEPDNSRLALLESDTKPLKTVPERAASRVRSLVDRVRRKD